MTKGFLNIVLHAHLPFVRHPEYEDFLEEDWLFEAISETYIPLLDRFTTLLRDGVKFKITMSITPPLSEMLVDPLLQSRYIKHIEKLVELSEKEVIRNKNNPDFYDTAIMYRNHFKNALEIFKNVYGGNILNGFKYLQENGVLEIITCNATHGFLPLINSQEAKYAQIKVGKENYKKHFGRYPRGIWLAECGYDGEIENILSRENLNFFFLDTHGILFGKPHPKYGVFAPVKVKENVYAFGRDGESSEEVWSSQRGYPGDYYYREFYRDLGYDADYEYIKPYLHSDGVRRNVGIKYYRITGKVDLGAKKPYIPQIGLEKAAIHAGDFLGKRINQVHHLNNFMDIPPIITIPFDAELFGHWWFEGPMFLEYLLRKIHYDQDIIETISPPEYIEMFHEKIEEQKPNPSSWGADGYNFVWLNGKNDWIYRHQHMAEDRMVELAKKFPEAKGLLKRFLNQCARELLLAESSDWAFIMTTGTTVPYATKRFKDHIHRFNKLYEMILSGNLDENYLKNIENKDTIFQEIDYRVYAG